MLLPAGVAFDMLDFLQEFFAAHPDVADNELYVTGESYAGHYVPAVSHKLWSYNKNPVGMKFNLKGLAIGVEPFLSAHSVAASLWSQAIEAGSRASYYSPVAHR
jgi:carboxypeptidase C (cathepsin A)